MSGSHEHRETDVQRAARTLPAPPDPEDYEPGEPSAARILIVDDDPDIARFVKVNLEEARGFANVQIAEDGLEALGRIQSEPFDLVISNVMMSGIDGFDLVRRIRNGRHTHDVLCMILSAKSLPTDVFLGFASGADDYMVKPFDPIELLAHVRALLRRGHQRPQRVTPG